MPVLLHLFIKVIHVERRYIYDGKTRPGTSPIHRQWLTRLEYLSHSPYEVRASELENFASGKRLVPGKVSRVLRILRISRLEHFADIVHAWRLPPGDSGAGFPGSLLRNHCWKRLESAPLDRVRHLFRRTGKRREASGRLSKTTHTSCEPLLPKKR